MESREAPRKNRLVLGLGAATGVVLLVLVAFLIGSGWFQEKSEPPEPGIKEGETVKRKGIPNPPPAVQPVKEERAKKGLQEGKTYLATSKGAVTMRGKDKDWAIVTAMTITYAFDAEVERKVERNDGKIIVELRHYRKVRSMKLDTTLDGVTFDLGPTGNLLLGGVALLKPETLPVVAGLMKAIQGADLKTALIATGLDQSLIDTIQSRDPSAHLFTRMGALEGKIIRLTYENRENGDCQVEAVKGDLSDMEKRFSAASVLLADAHILPDLNAKEGDQWRVRGSNMMGLMDPSLLAYTDGEIVLKCGGQELVSGQKKRCLQLKVTEGELTFKRADRKAEEMGYFRPRGYLLFAPDDLIIVDGQMQGQAQFTVRSKDHLLFEARSERTPEMKVHYSCRILDVSGK